MERFRRHLKTCPYRLKGRRHWRCHCPIWFDGTIDRRRVLKSMNCTDWNAAQELAQKWLAGDVKITARPEPQVTAKEQRNGPISVEQALRKFIVQTGTRNLSPSTVYKYNLLCRQMLDFVGRNRIESLQDLDLEGLECFLAEGNEGPLTRSKKIERVKAFFRFAHERHWITDDPARLVKAPQVRQRPTLPFTQEEMAAILAAVERYPDKAGKTGRPNSQRIRAFVLTLRYTGLRIGDATSLSVDRLMGNKIFLRSQKTGQEVFCVVPPFVADALENVPRLSDRYFFWTGNSTLHTAIGSWQRTLQKLFQLAGLRSGHAHRFRDTFAVELLLAGVPTEEVAVLLGHSNIAITQKHYSPWVRSRQRQLEANLERAWSHDPIVLLHDRARSASRKDAATLPN